jgi:arsenite-transporting ATPase
MDLLGSDLHCVSADLPSLACALVEAEQRLPGRAGAAVLDLSGEQWLAPPSGATAAAGAYTAVPYATQLWQQLEPRLEAWLQLLQLQQLEPLLVPPLPGVDMLLRCLALAEALSEQRPLTVLLPAPGEALALLELARTGPALVESLLEPLLAWWDQTRQSLSSLELMLRLKLPSSESLRLDASWRQRLEQMAALLAPEADWQFSLALECPDPQARLLRQRFSAISLRGFLPSRVGLHGAAAALLAAQRPSWWPEELTATALLNLWDPKALEAFVAQEPCAARPHLDTEASVLRLPMPGVDKAQLDVQQIGAQIVLISGGLRRLVALPERLQNQRCSGARLEQGWLELRFS